MKNFTIGNVMVNVQTFLYKTTDVPETYHLIFAAARRDSDGVGDVIMVPSFSFNKSGSVIPRRKVGIETDAHPKEDWIMKEVEECARATIYHYSGKEGLENIYIYVCRRENSNDIGIVADYEPLDQVIMSYKRKT